MVANVADQLRQVALQETALARLQSRSQRLTEGVEVRLRKRRGRHLFGPTIAGQINHQRLAPQFEFLRSSAQRVIHWQEALLDRLVESARSISIERSGVNTLSASAARAARSSVATGAAGVLREPMHLADARIGVAVVIPPAVACRQGNDCAAVRAPQQAVSQVGELTTPAGVTCALAAKNTFGAMMSSTDTRTHPPPWEPHREDVRNAPEHVG